MTWISKDVDSQFSAVFSLRENLYAEFLKFEQVFHDKGLLDETLMALCQLRVAQLHRCASGMKAVAGLSPEKREALSDWHRADCFTALEKAVLSVAECFCMDPHSITDDMAAAVVAGLGDAGLVALLEYLAICDGFTRFRLTLAIES